MSDDDDAFAFGLIHDAQLAVQRAVEALSVARDQATPAVRGLDRAHMTATVLRRRLARIVEDRNRRAPL